MSNPNEVDFPLQGWIRDGSTSYGSDELYRGMRRVAVNIIPESQVDTARKTFDTLISNGVKSAHIEPVRHQGTDGLLYYYVFAEEKEFNSFCERLHLNVTLAQKNRGKAAIAQDAISRLAHVCLGVLGIAFIWTLVNWLLHR